MTRAIDDKNFTRKLNKFEIQCITGNFVRDDFSIDLELYRSSDDYELIRDLYNLMANITNHEYKEAMQTEYACLNPLKDVCKDFTLVFYEMYSQMKSNYQYLFHPENEDCPYVKQLILLLVGVSALQEFVRANICEQPIYGIPPSDAVYQMCTNFLPDSHFSEESILDALGRDGEVVITKIAQPKLLYLSLMLLFGNSFDKCLTHKWWLLRCLMMHQKILPDTIAGLHQSITTLISMQAQAYFLNNKEEPFAEVMFNVECAQVHMYYHELNVAERYLVSAQNVLGLGVKFSIALTKHQRSNMPVESFVTVKRNDKRYKSNVVINDCVFPNIILEINGGPIHIDLIDSNGNRMEELLPEEQIVLLAYCDLLRKWKRKHATQEEDRVILDCLLSHPKIWAVQVKALFLKCQREKQDGLDIKTLINQMKVLIAYLGLEIRPSLKQNLLYCAALPMHSKMQKLLADAKLMSAALHQALNIYEEFRLWKGAISCYKMLDLVPAGIKTLEEEISVKPSSLLWCHLGDLTDKIEVYTVAWDLSRHTNARSQRSLGYYYYIRKQYKKSIQYFNESLAVNHLQPKVLRCMGRAALACDDFELAIDVYSRILEMDDNNFVAWNQLSRAYIMKGQKVDACRSLLEAQNFHKEVDTSDNCLLISAKIGDYSNVIKKYYNHLQKLHGTIWTLTDTDIEVLRTLVDAIVRNACDINNVPSGTLKNRVLNLFERITSVMSPNVKFWELYIFFISAGTNVRTDARAADKIVSLQKRTIKHRLANMLETSHDLEYALNAVLDVYQLCKAYIRNTSDRRITNSKYSTLKKQEAASLRSFLAEVILKVEHTQFDFSFSKKVKYLLLEIKQKEKDMARLLV